MTAEDLGNEIQRARETLLRSEFPELKSCGYDTGITRKEFQALTGINFSTLSQYEQGYCVPSRVRLKMIVDFLKLDIKFDQIVRD